MLFLADALDSVQMDDTSFRDSIEMGVLYSCVLPGSGNIIGGRSAVIRNWARTSTEALLARAGIKAAFGHNPRFARDWKGTRPWTRMGALSLLRKRLEEVRQKTSPSGKRRKKPELTAEERLIHELLTGRELLRAHVHKEDDIAALLRLKDEFGLRITVEHACDVHDPDVYETLRAQGIPVVYGPLDAFAYKVELRHENWRNVRYLIESGVDYGLMTDHPVIPQRNLLLELRWFVRCGLDRQGALEVITRRNATILGIDDRLGTLEKAKLASFTCWSGDPFDSTSWPVLVVAEGKKVYEEGAEKPRAGGRPARRAAAHGGAPG
jgi:imidazolonepropionase-like amidohydrolase